MESLLGQFYTRIKGSQEDIASEGLVYILQRSHKARTSISNIIKNHTNIDLDDLNYIAQNVDDKQERPDISGRDINGKEKIIIEAKFWASLTSNQPIEYLNRLGNEGVLIFVCPSLRIRSLYDELIRKIKEKWPNSRINEQDFSIIIDGNKHLLVKSWDELLQNVRHQLVEENNIALIGDIDQIKGFCDIIDTKSFLPIRSEELSPSIPKRIISFYNLLDQVVNDLKIQQKIDISGLQATGQRFGYTRYARMYGFGLSIDLNFNCWADKIDTPFWLGIQLIKDNKWQITDELTKACKSISNTTDRKYYQRDNLPYFPLIAKIDQTEDLVIKDISSQIIFLIDKIHFELTNS